MSFLSLEGKTFLVMGVANRKSVAYAVTRELEAAGAAVVHVVRDDATRDAVRRLTNDAPVLTCDVRDADQVRALPEAVAEHTECLDGFMHSIAHANYSRGFCPFHETEAADFLDAVHVSCFSLVELTRGLKPLLQPEAGIVTVSISSTRVAAENYGYMAPIKAALDSSVVFLAKSLSADTQIRVNAVGAGLLKTSSSAGIPGYVDSYLYAEQVIPRRRALETAEVARTAAFLLSPASSGINAQTVVVDAGLSINSFDRDVVRRVVAAQ